MSASDVFVDAAWLYSRLDDPSMVPVEASFYLPDEGKNADALFRAAHIPGAVRFDVDEVADHSVALPHMLPDASTFSAMVGKLGVSNDQAIVVYDATDLLGGARAWWMFRRYGARNVRILDGGFKAWIAGGYPVESGASQRPAAKFEAHFDDASVVDAAQVLAAVESGSAQIVDARSPARFAGAVPEPRPGLRSGHIPRARNVPWREIVDETGRLRPDTDLAGAFATAGVDLSKPLVASCGSGVSAAVLILGLERLGKADTRLYDGSWSEWGGRADLPLETGPAS